MSCLGQIRKLGLGSQGIVIQDIVDIDPINNVLIVIPKAIRYCLDPINNVFLNFEENSITQLLYYEFIG